MTNDEGLVLGFLKDPFKDDYEDLREVVETATGRIMFPSGQLGSISIIEAAREAAAWWNDKGRGMVPDARRDAAYMNQYGINSGILNGAKWEWLSKSEKMRVTKTWVQFVGVITHALAMDTNAEDAVFSEVTKLDLHRVFKNPINQRGKIH
jgi:hypothetical protein